VIRRSRSRSRLWRAALALTIALGGCSDDDGALPSPVSLQQLIDACVISAACGLQARPRVSNCVDYYADSLRAQGKGPIYDEIFGCVVAAGGDCDAVAACFGAGEPCERATFQASCSEGRAVSCDLIDKRVYVTDCSVAGLDCVVGVDEESFAAHCACGSTFGGRCFNGWAVVCAVDEPQGADCAAQGRRCVDGACVPEEPAEPCKLNAFVDRCEGKVAVRCIGGFVGRIDCSQRLTERYCEGGRCVPAGDACSDEFNRCKGDLLEACIDGSWQQIDCAALGRGPCRSATHGANCS